MGRTRRDSCRNLFKELEILLLVSQYTFSLMLFVIKNWKQYTDNTEIYEIKTRQQRNLHQPLADLKKYQKGIHYLRIKVYNNLPSYIKKKLHGLSPRANYTDWAIIYKVYVKWTQEIWNKIEANSTNIFFYSLQEYFNCGFVGHEVWFS
jgi:hypothetical protein